MKKAVQIGSVFAEFGVSANINQTNNADPFKDIDAPAVRNLDTSPVQLIWEQHKTGTLGGLDQFEILFYTEALDELIYKVDGVSLAPSGIKYTYQMPKAKVLELVQAVSKLPYKPEQKIVIVIKGTASGGNVSSGPFYGNAEEFTVKLNSRFSVIAVDSSGSNEWNDPSNLRISAGNTMLNNMGLRNDRILAGTEAGKLMSVATIDFDTSVRVLSNFTDPKGLNFNSVDSLGGTDIAAAINRSITLIQAVRPTPNPLPKPDANTPRIYALTDMEGAGNDVTQAILRAGQNNIVFNLGHLVPLVIKAAPADLAGEKMRPKVAEPMDPIIAATLSTGGSYATIETAAAQQAWVDLMDELNNSTPFSRTTINLPLSVKLYGFAQDSGIPEPTYVFTATASGRVTVTVDGKGNFVPALTVDGVSGQNSIGQDQYAREFNVVAGQVYQINLNEDAAASGLYSIVLRQTSTVASPVIQTPTLAPGVVGSAYSPVTLSVVGGHCTLHLDQCEFACWHDAGSHDRGAGWDSHGSRHFPVRHHCDGQQFASADAHGDGLSDGEPGRPLHRGAQHGARCNCGPALQPAVEPSGWRGALHLVSHRSACGPEHRWQWLDQRYAD